MVRRWSRDAALCYRDAGRVRSERRKIYAQMLRMRKRPASYSHYHAMRAYASASRVRVRHAPLCWEHGVKHHTWNAHWGARE